MGWRLGVAILPALLCAGCGGEATGTVRVDLVPPSSPAAEQSLPPVAAEAPPRTEPPEDPRHPEPAPEPLEPPEDLFLPGFFQNLRASRRAEERVTLRFRVPVTRSGGRVQLVVLAGNSSLVIHQATMARPAGNGSLSGEARTLKFAGSGQATVPGRQRLVSDALAFEVRAPEDLVVSLDVEGGVGASLIHAFPDSWIAPGGQAYHTHLSDHRAAWPYLAFLGSGMPVANGAVSGQSIYQASEELEREVGWLPRVSHCLVHLGTNDLAALESAELKARLGKLFAALRPRCEVWAGTLVPRERADGTELALVHARRAEVNAWLRTLPPNVSRVVDFAEATHAEGDVNRFRDGFSHDGIHPTLAGQRAMGERAAGALQQAR
jgi:lysophospholipase L1-like esterase